MTGGSLDVRAWDRVSAAIRSMLPQWARYSGYGTYALAGYVYVVLFALAAVWFFAKGAGYAWVFGVASVLSWLLAGYYKGAAKLRVRCSQCGRPARGNSQCPYCDKPTYMGENA